MEKSREKGALAVDIPTPGGSVVLRNHDVRFAKGSDNDVGFFSGFLIPSKSYYVSSTPHGKGHPFIGRAGVFSLLTQYLADRLRIFLHVRETERERNFLIPPWKEA